MTIPPSPPPQLVRLSKENISFDCVPLFCQESRLIFLENTSPDHVVSYMWKTKGSSAEGVIFINPPLGYLKPHEVTTCTVTLFSEGRDASINQ